ncbi:MAG: DUF819 family protein [Xanthomonadales bacterium]|nr:DUF819 family protein [Xanthomonadales bacterium]
MMGNNKAISRVKLSMSLIGAESTALLWAAILGIAAFGFWSEQNTRWGKALTGIIIAMAAAMLLSNLKIMPAEAPVYGSIFKHILPLAIPMLLFRADVREAMRVGGPTLWAFGIGAVTVMLGVALAHVLVPLGELSGIAAGLFTATYIGGSANFAAVAIATGFSEGNELTAMVAADVIATNVQTMVLIALPGIPLVCRWLGAKTSQQAGAVDKPIKPFILRELDLFGLTLSLAVAFALVAAGDAIAAWLAKPSLAILITSALALLISNFCKPLVTRMSGDYEFGTFLIYLFLIAVAAEADVWKLIETGPIFLVYIAIVLSVHTLLLLLVARFMRRLTPMDVRAVVIGSTACIGGMVTASAIASAKGWQDLIVPGIMAGTLGNAMGSFLGVAAWSLLS